MVGNEKKLQENLCIAFIFFSYIWSFVCNFMFLKMQLPPTTLLKSHFFRCIFLKYTVLSGVWHPRYLTPSTLSQSILANCILLLHWTLWLIPFSFLVENGSYLCCPLTVHTDAVHPSPSTNGHKYLSLGRYKYTVWRSGPCGLQNL